MGKGKTFGPYLIGGIITLAWGIIITCFYSITTLKELNGKILPEVLLLLTPIFFGIALIIIGIFIIYLQYKNDKKTKKT